MRGSRYGLHEKHTGTWSSCTRKGHACRMESTKGCSRERDFLGGRNVRARIWASCPNRIRTFRAP